MLLNGAVSSDNLRGTPVAQEQSKSGPGLRNKIVSAIALAEKKIVGNKPCSKGEEMVSEVVIRRALSIGIIMMALSVFCVCGILHYSNVASGYVSSAMRAQELDYDPKIK